MNVVHLAEILRVIDLKGSKRWWVSHLIRAWLVKSDKAFRQSCKDRFSHTNLKLCVNWDVLVCWCSWAASVDHGWRPKFSQTHTQRMNAPSGSVYCMLSRASKTFARFLKTFIIRGCVYSITTSSIQLANSFCSLGLYMRRQRTFLVKLIYQRGLNWNSTISTTVRGSHKWMYSYGSHENICQQQ